MANGEKIEFKSIIWVKEERKKGGKMSKYNYAQPGLLGQMRATNDSGKMLELLAKAKTYKTMSKDTLRKIHIAAGMRSDGTEWVDVGGN